MNDKRKPVLAIDANGKVYRHKSATAAAKAYNIVPATVYFAIRKHRQTNTGYFFLYEQEAEVGQFKEGDFVRVNYKHHLKNNKIGKVIKSLYGYNLVDLGEHHWIIDTHLMEAK